MADSVFTDCSPIFVVGTGRSGTTMLRLMLNAHPNVAICDEIHYFDEIAQIKRQLPSLEEPEDLESLLTYIANTQTASWYLENESELFESAKQRLQNESLRTYEKFYRYLLEQFASFEGASRYGEKTPANIRYLDEIVDIFPNAKIIHIVRDPRAVIASRINMTWASDDILIPAFKWKFEIQYSQDFAARSDSYIRVRYEDLVSNPEAHLRRICEFIGEEYDSKMMDFYKTARQYTYSYASWSRATDNPVNDSAVERWRQELSERQLYIIQKILGRLMDRFGYQRSEISLNSKLMSPASLFIEMFKASRYVLGLIVREMRESHVIFSENRRLYDLAKRSIFSRNS